MTKEKEEPDYQTLSNELDMLLSNLQRSDIQVDEAMKLYKQGLGLIKKMEERLAQAENELIRLKAKSSVNIQGD